MSGPSKRNLIISATFTAEPLEPVLAFWCRALELGASVRFAPYDQVFPQLLNPASEMSCNTAGLNIILLRIEDLARGNPAASRGRTSEFIGAVDAAATRCPTPLMVVLCPPSDEAALREAHEAAEEQLAAQWPSPGKVTLVRSAEIAERYPVAAPLDPRGDGPAHIPYSDEYFAALASTIARHARLRFTPPTKVIVLDCDNTLWGGACAEEGASGVVVEPGHRAFHRALIEQQNAGALLCICSKNRPEDVHETLDSRTDIALDRREHFVAERISWDPKSKALAELAEELNLGLDSFLFIDDNPVECAEVRAALPEVVAVRAPADPASYPSFIAHLWPLDHSTGTAEDGSRTQLYRDESRRRRARDHAPSFSAFLENLELEVDIAPAGEADLARIAQLTQRTNQFNAVPQPLTEDELRARLEEGEHLLAIRVRDRFGDYGLAGAVLERRDEGLVEVLALFLSCRVLGRGVEHRLISNLASRQALGEHSSLRLHYRPSERNEPIRQFLEQIPVTGKEQLDDARVVYDIPAGIEMRPSGESGATGEAPRAPKPRRPRAESASTATRNQTLARTPHELDSAAAILACVKSQRRRRPEVSGAFSLPRPGLEHEIAAIWEDVLSIETVGALDPFSELGGRSLQLAQVHSKLSSELGIDLTLEELFGLPTIRSMAERIEGTGQRPLDRRNLRKALKTRPDIAVVGLALKVPGAGDPDAFWSNLKGGVESISELTDEQLAAAGVDLDAVRSDPCYIRSKGILEGIDLFDAAFFGILPKDAEMMDPQQRLFLELAHEALERAGYNAEGYPGKIGVYAGAYLDTYLISNLCRDTEFLDGWVPEIQVGALSTELGNDKDYLATRVAYKLNLRGPSMTLQTACSTSLVAIAQACQSLVTNQSDMALAGGVTITVPQAKGYVYQEGGILSPDGHCRAFDHRAAGTVFSNGGGAVLLKRLDDAIEDGDHIYSVIRGFALNNDGGEKHSYTAPSVAGQSDVIAMAQEMAGVDPATITCVEAHGTGTSLGDPIEVAGLSEAFRRKTEKTEFCALGSLKPNLGHLDVASGVVAVSKMSLALEHGQIPPLINFEKANPGIDFESSPFYINTELREWQPAEGAPRRAGVSSFGVGGTNAHVVMEEAPARRLLPSTRGEFLFPVSAKTPTALESAANNLADWFEERPGVAPDDAAFTLQVGRKSFAHRRFVVAGSTEEAAAALRKPGGRSWQTDTVDPPVVFMFPGQGAQKVNMARGLYAGEPFFREQINNCAEILKPEIGLDIRDVIFPPEGADTEAAAERLKHTVVAQPAIFVIENAMARLWMHWGVRPKAMIGHSVGEFAAACIAGVFSLEEGLRVLAERGRLMGDLPRGSMLSVRAPEDSLSPYLEGQVELAAVNGPELCVAAGPDEAIAELGKRLEADGITSKPLHTSHAFHSWMMDPVIDPFTEVLESVDLKAPEIPIFSTVTNAPLAAEQATDPTYWARHLRNPVRFFGAVEHFWGMPEHVLLEVGPGNTLATLARQNPDRASRQAVYASSAHATSEKSDASAFLEALGSLWACGVEIDWDAYYSYEKRGRIPLPTYPFERKRFWKEPPAQASPSPIPALPPAPVELATAANTIINEPPPAMSEPNDRIVAIESRIKEELSDLSGFDPADLDTGVSFLELGFDSLLLTQVSKALDGAFGVKVTLRDLLDEHPSIGAIAALLDAELPADQFAGDPAPTAEPAAAQAVPQPATAAPAFETAAPSPVPANLAGPMPQMPMQGYPMMPWPGMPMPDPSGQMAALAQQVQALSQQVATLVGPQAPAAPTPIPEIAPPTADTTPASPPPTSREEPDKVTATPGPGLKIDRSVDTSLSEQQQRHIDELVRRYTEKTGRSKELTQRYRKRYADPRTASGFNRLWKEMCYQIVVERSKGSRLLDRDGNEYIDLLNGFGPGFLGHSPDFVVEALHAQIDKGFEVGPQSPIAGEVAELFCEVTGNERASFVNTGSEAVQAAMRLSRTVTGRDKIALFAKDYHGNFDEVLVRGVGSGDKARSLPSAPGIPRRAVEDILVLPYGTDESLEILKQHADELAAVLVEPVQSRRPEFQPVNFVKELRELTARSGTLLVFDEVITGFRTGPGGAQSWFGVEADLATYGKVVGGGMPIGVVAGKAEHMDTFDGGFWSYGDDSFPEKPVTFFAGTFVRHPLAMAAAKATLEFLRDADPSLWDGLRAKANRLAGTVDSFFADNEIPIRMPNFGSQMFVRVAEEEKYANLLFYHLREKGVFLLESFPSYMTIAHSDEDVDYVIDAFKESAAELQDAGFFADSKPVGPAPREKLSGPPRQLGEAGGQGEGGTAAAAKRSAPTTEAQKEILIASRNGPEASCAFNEPAVLNLKGELDPDALRGALNELLSRHDALRARFPDGGEEFVIESEAHIELELEDIAELPEEGKAAAIEAAMANEASAPFDLAGGPLVRARLLRTSGDEHLLLITAHHIVCDGWSFNVLVEELGEIYGAAVDGREVELSEAPEFAEYARSKMRERHSEARGEAKDYWLGKHEGVVEESGIPTDRPRPNLSSYRAAVARAQFEKGLLDKLRKSGAKAGATLFSTFVAGFQSLLHRLSGDRDVIVGIPAAGQTVGRWERLVGHCVDFLPLRSTCEGTTSFRDLLADAKSSMAQAFEHREFAYGEIIRALAGTGREPRVEFVINFERMDSGSGFGPLDVEFTEGVRRFSNHTIFANLIETDSGVEVHWHYNRDLFDEDTMQRWIRQFETLLSAAAEDPASEVAKLPLLDAAAVEEIVRGFNPPEQPPATEGISALFRTQAASTPDATAIATEGASLSYSELDLLSDSAASRLIEAGVSHGDRVAVFLERSPDLIVTLLGILKAGAAYVPIDPDYPRARVALMLSEAGAKAVVSNASLSGSIPTETEDTVVLLADSPDFFDPPSSGFAPRPSAPDDLAYVIFTSGSTGKPKGVAVPHRGVVRLVKDTDYADLGPEQVFLQAAALSFDASTLEIWAPLLNGGKLVLLPPGTPSPGAIADAIERHSVTIMFLTSGLFQLMVDERHEALRGLKQLITGGDVVSVAHVRRAFDCLPGCRLIHAYGPTENTTFTTCHTITEADLAGDTITIGKAIAGSQVYILDDAMQPVPVGVPGELYTGGKGLALGYLGDPERTSEAFVDNPLSGTPGDKLYRSGDLCRFLPDGNIEFIGRRDRQVKIRGFRIERGEIENAIASLPGVARCAVAVRGSDASEKTLAAYLVPSNGDLDLAAVRDALKSQLPSHLLPEAITSIDALPLNPSGKVDYRALPEPEIEIEETVSTPPEGETELALQSLWQELLDTDRIGAEDNFFDLGGHSLLGLRMITRIEKQFGQSLPLAALFEAATIRELAQRIDNPNDPSDDHAAHVVAIQPGNSGATPFFAIHGGDGGALFYRHLVPEIGDEQPLFAIESPLLRSSTLDGVPDDVSGIAAEYIEQIRPCAGGKFRLGGYSFGGVIAYEMACQLAAAGEEVDLLALFDTCNPAVDPRPYTLAERVAANWNSQKKSGIAGKIGKLGERLASGLSERRHRNAVTAEARALLAQNIAARDEELRRFQLNEISNRLMEAYLPPVFPGRLTLFKAETPDDKFEYTDLLGWEDLAADGVEVVTVPGAHLTIFDEENAGALARALRERLLQPTALTR